MTRNEILGGLIGGLVGCVGAPLIAFAIMGTDAGSPARGCQDTLLRTSTPAASCSAGARMEPAGDYYVICRCPDRSPEDPHVGQDH